ncbi:helix-turn-helix transcriptional regulator [Mitsuaria sp. WAJ17]|uniref:ArsR/SmtB family transcription factor n=1 Tax=Mitsuaria sp. WAJ17 TaxID=2761452 RepID=UPI0015FFA6F9|nr:helix-turn-helix transcriptional regulator [Mitsuaria sp. WAJ17]MBB2487207.1 helix-turn-helix transcriptional regulator [Mitsuaria sp. WAJ17]
MPAADLASPHEPRIARVAAAMGDPARSRMLAYLMSGAYASAGELARAGSVSPATASGHLARLAEAGLLRCESRGRHRYYQLAGPEVAHALEALALVAERDSHDRQWAAPARQRLRAGRCCYGHLAGQLGVQLYERLHAVQGLRPSTEGFQLTETGHAWLQGLGLCAPAPTRRRYAYACLDWSERRDHLAGLLAESILQHCLDRGWLRRGEGRAVELTPPGVQHLLPQLTA